MDDEVFWIAWWKWNWVWSCLHSDFSLWLLVHGAYISWKSSILDESEVKHQSLVPFWQRCAYYHLCLLSEGQLLYSWLLDPILNSQRIFLDFIHCAPYIVNNHVRLLKEVISLEGDSLHSCQSPLENARRDISMKVCCMSWQMYWCHSRALYFVDVSNCQSSQLPLCSSGLLFQVEHCSVGDLCIHIWVYIED